MTQTPVPTPYDIVPPPGGPLTPGPAAWLALIICGALAWCYLYLRYKGPRARSVKHMLHVLCSELQMAISNSASPDLDRVSRIARRIVSQFISGDVTGLSAAEMQRLAHSLKGKTDDASQSISRVLSLLSIIEEHSYAPQKHQSDPTLRQALTDLFSTVENHVRRYDPL